MQCGTSAGNAERLDFIGVVRLTMGRVTHIHTKAAFLSVPTPLIRVDYRIMLAFDQHLMTCDNVTIFEIVSESRARQNATAQGDLACID